MDGASVADDKAAYNVVLHQSSPNFAFTQPASTIDQNSSLEDNSMLVMRSQQNLKERQQNPPFTAGLTSDKQLNESVDILNEMQSYTEQLESPQKPKPTPGSINEIRVAREYIQPAPFNENSA